MVFIRPAEGTITQYFKKGTHNGIDIAKSGTVPILAAALGTVTKSYNSDSYGEVVFIKHVINGVQYETVYAHMAERSRTVSVGQNVSVGQRLGYMGSTGWWTGQHLHFEVHKPSWNSSKSYAVNPLDYINSGGGGGTEGPGTVIGEPQPEYAGRTKNGRIGTATTIVSTLNVRNSPSTSGRIIRTLSLGSTAWIYKLSGEWYCIGTNNGEEEWISNENRAHANVRWYDLKSGRIGEGSVKVSLLNVRYSPTETGELSRKIGNGTSFYVYKESGYWLCIGTKDGREEWIANPNNEYANVTWY
ncbi:M23 family metallopeptidase [Bacillus aquiflavi]|uniref:M23 family metallopeptidase n=1 Tax=Bacillus aquiflavi TaxID=2672567 RepID=UPI001CA8D3C9|nr:M23 family metallopeptidase [Bacillus aquiflavi]UAC47860.1 M23 family metallopeptidase [Bacillus aquiflavi]